ncbi:MAG: arsenic metallochaperone ArsD family protein [Armatimonadetes bacterium]|jgi:hypothetical protein|nr:arsenic metallochaperone ArsD family protein [Armatimonadota bacterium]
MPDKPALVEIFEPPLCCPGGNCKPGVDSGVIDIFEALGRLAGEHGDRVVVRRLVVPRDLRRVRGDAGLRERLAQWQTQGLLPVTCVDGEVAKTRTYPTYEELLVLTGITAEPEDARGEQRPGR